MEHPNQIRWSSILLVQADSPFTSAGIESLPWLGGRIESRAFDLFESKWLQAVFSQVRSSFLNEAFGEHTDAKYVPVDVDFVRMMTYNIVLRALSVVRNGRHGGTLVIVHPDDEALIRTPEAALRFKYLIGDCPARRRYARMLRQAIIRLAKLASHHRRPNAGWTEYQTLLDTELSDMDEALFDFAHFLADLMAVDGALVVTQALDLVGFGAELRFEATGLEKCPARTRPGGRDLGQRTARQCRDPASCGVPVLSWLSEMSGHRRFARWIRSICQEPQWGGDVLESTFMVSSAWKMVQSFPYSRPK